MAFATLSNSSSSLFSFFFYPFQSTPSSRMTPRISFCQSLINQTMREREREKEKESKHYLLRTLTFSTKISYNGSIKWKKKARRKFFLMIIETRLCAVRNVHSAFSFQFSIEWIWFFSLWWMLNGEQERWMKGGWSGWKWLWDKYNKKNYKREFRVVVNDIPIKLSFFWIFLNENIKQFMKLCHQAFLIQNVCDGNEKYLKVDGRLKLQNVERL